MPRKKPSRTAAAPLEPLLVTKGEAARLLGVTEVTVACWSANGTLVPVVLPSTARRRPSAKALRRTLFHRDDVLALANRGRVAS